MTVAIETKLCEHCRNPFSRRPRWSRGQWAEKRFCSHKCSALFRIGRPMPALSKPRERMEPRLALDAPLAPRSPIMRVGTRSRILQLYASGMRITAIAAELRLPYRELIAVIDGRPA